MTHTSTKRRAAGAVVAALALSVGAPTAGARPFDLNPAGSFVPVGSAQTAAPNATSHTNGGDISDWGYVAIGSGAASLALLGIGGTRAAGRRRHRRRTTGAPTIAA